MHLIERYRKSSRAKVPTKLGKHVARALHALDHIERAVRATRALELLAALAAPQKYGLLVRLDERACHQAQNSRTPLGAAHDNDGTRDAFGQALVGFFDR